MFPGGEWIQDDCDTCSYKLTHSGAPTQDLSVEIVLLPCVVVTAESVKCYLRLQWIQVDCDICSYKLTHTPRLNIFLLILYHYYYHHHRHLIIIIIIIIIRLLLLLMYRWKWKMLLSIKFYNETCGLHSSLEVPYPVPNFSGSLKPLLSLWTLLRRRQPITMTAMANPTKAVTPNVILAAVPASILSGLPWEDFCLSGVAVPLERFMPTIPGPSILISAANSKTDLRDKAEKYYNNRISSLRDGSLISSSWFNAWNLWILKG